MRAPLDNGTPGFYTHNKKQVRRFNFDGDDRVQYGFNTWNMSDLLQKSFQIQIHSGDKISNMDKVTGQHWALMKKNIPVNRTVNPYIKHKVLRQWSQQNLIYA